MLWKQAVIIAQVIKGHSLESLATVVIMVPVMIALLLGSIYGLGELFNLFSAVGGKKS